MGNTAVMDQVVSVGEARRRCAADSRIGIIRAEDGSRWLIEVLSVIDGNMDLVVLARIAESGAVSAPSSNPAASR